jgi:hypothetical protein
MKLYKILTGDNRGPISRYKWDMSGNWMPDVGTPSFCRNGYYGMQKQEISSFLESLSSWEEYNLWIIEIEGAVMHFKDKWAGSRARIIRLLGDLKGFMEPGTQCSDEYYGSMMAYTCGDYHYSSMYIHPTTCPHTHLNVDLIPDLEQYSNIPEFDNASI